jgi:hypothetical protein
MRGAVPPFPSTPSWRGAELKHKDEKRDTLREGLCTYFLEDVFECDIAVETLKSSGLIYT